MSLSLLAYLAADGGLLVAGASTDVAVADPWLAGVGVTWRSATALWLSLSLLSYLAADGGLLVAGASTDVAVADPWLARVGVTWAVFVHLAGVGFISRRWRAAVRRSVMNVSG